MNYLTKLSILRSFQVTAFFYLELYIINYLTNNLFESLHEEKTLRKRYETLISSVEESLIVIGSNLKINFVSKKLMGQDSIFYIGKDIEDFEFLNKDQIKNLNLQEKSCWKWEDKGRDYLFKATPIKDEGEILIVCLDQTDSKKNKENELKLIKAETSLKSKIEFIASISHEIRNPLQCASFSIENLAETDLDNIQTEYLNDIKQSNELASGIIGDILDMSKIEAGKMKICFQNINIVELCERSLDYNFYQAEKKKINLFFTFDPKVPKEFECDPIRLLQILNNFISNAIKYSQKGNIFLNIEITREKFIKFSVKDEGIGISKEVIMNIFTPFEQFDHQSLNHESRKGWVRIII